MAESTTTLLLNIMEQLGDLKADVATVMSGLGFVQEKQKSLASDIEKIKSKTDKIDLISLDVNTLKPKVERLMSFMGRVGAVVGVASIIMYGALALIQASAVFVFDYIKHHWW